MSDRENENLKARKTKANKEIMNKCNGIYNAKRYYPDKDFEEFTGIYDRVEIVTAAGYYSNIIDDIYMYDEKWCNDIIVPTGKYDSKGVHLCDIVTEDQLNKIIEKEKKELDKDEHLVYYERYAESKMLGKDEFEFCGYDLLDEGGGQSAITDCGDLNARFVHKLNKYGLLDTLEEAIEEQKQLRIDYPDEDHADCDIYGIWRYIKP